MMSVYPRFSTILRDRATSLDITKDDIYVSYDPVAEPQQAGAGAMVKGEYGPPPPCPGSLSCSSSYDSGIKDTGLSVDDVCKIIKATVAPLEKKIDNLTENVQTLVSEIKSLKKGQSVHAVNSDSGLIRNQETQLTDNDECDSGSSTPVAFHESSKCNYFNTCTRGPTADLTETPFYVNYEHGEHTKDLDLSDTSSNLKAIDTDASDSTSSDSGSVKMFRNNSYMCMSELPFMNEARLGRKRSDTLPARPVEARVSVFRSPSCNYRLAQRMEFDPHQQCSVCKLVSRVNVKRFADILWANDALQDGLYSRVCCSVLPTGRQGMLWKEVLSIINKSCPNVARCSIDSLVEFIAQYDPDLSSGLSKLSFQCENKLRCCCKYAPSTL